MGFSLLFFSVQWFDHVSFLLLVSHSLFCVQSALPFAFFFLDSSYLSHILSVSG